MRLMMVSGSITELMVGENSRMSIRTSMRVSGPMIRLMVEASIDTRMVPHTMGSGKTIFNMEEVLRSGLMDRSIRESTSKARSTAMVFTNGTTSLGTKESGLRTRSVEWVSTLGSMAEASRENGSITTWKAMESTNGLMEEFIKENTKTTRNTALACTLGWMIGNTLASGP